MQQQSIGGTQMWLSRIFVIPWCSRISWFLPDVAHSTIIIIIDYKEASDGFPALGSLGIKDTKGRGCIHPSCWFNTDG